LLEGGQGGGPVLKGGNSNKIAAFHEDFQGAAA
jgi:hypothetical protein